jgi:hypothetical protein
MASPPESFPSPKKADSTRVAAFRAGRMLHWGGRMLRALASGNSPFRAKTKKSGGVASPARELG